MDPVTTILGIVAIALLVVALVLLAKIYRVVKREQKK